MPAMNNILSKWVPEAERSRSLALVYSGMYLGSVTGLAFSPLLIHNLGWPSVFYSFGSLGAVWFAIWLNKAHSSPLDDPELSPQEKKLIVGHSVSKEPVKSIPWRLILSKPPVCALIASHFCYNWGTFILLTWMPTYYNQVLKFNLIEFGLFCVLPWLTIAFSANLGGWIADTLVSRGLSITVARKVMQSIGFLAPAFFLTQLSHVHSPAMAVLCMACSQGYPQEKVGVFVRRGRGRPLSVLEYSEMDQSMTSKINRTTGLLRFCWSNVCLHMFTLDFLNQVANGLEKDSIHHAENGLTTGLKLEQFIFDAFVIYSFNCTF